MTKAALNSAAPRISVWMVATRENIEELPDLVRMAARIGVPEVYVQRIVYFAGERENQYGMARDDLAIFGHAEQLQEEIISECEALSVELGIAFRASGARDPRNSLAAAQSSSDTPWQACMRPFTTAYVTANGNCLPCCISPFTTSDYRSLILGNLFEQPFADIWNGATYAAFRRAFLSDRPHKACASCGVYWSL